MSEGRAARGLAAALRLAIGRSDAVARFEDTPAAYWHALLSAGLAAIPGVIVLKLAGAEAVQAGSSGAARMLAAEAIAYLVGWTLFPVVMLSIARALNRRAQVLRYLVGWNWTNLVQVMVQAPLGLLSLAGLLPGAVLDGLTIAALLWGFWYGWLLARHALDISGGQAAMVVAIDLFTSLLVSTIALHMHRTGPVA
ncbi:MAG: hypothetical protein IT557_11785 [Alphaproteobacteria bacterium]|nr:hypothetical protein [Alphaproteobacteria bacterium]